MYPYLKTSLAIFVTLRIVSSYDLLDAVLAGNKKEAKRALEGNVKPSALNKLCPNGFNALLVVLGKRKMDAEWEDIAAEIIEKGADLRRSLPGGKCAPLHLAVEVKSPRLVNALLKREKDLDLEARNEYDYTPFLLAIKNARGRHPLLVTHDGDVTLNSDMKDIIKRLIRAGANIEAEIDTARSLHFSAVTANPFLANTLLTAGAEVDSAYTEDMLDYTPLYLLLRSNAFAGEESKRKDCMIAYVNNGADLSRICLADKILRRFSRTAFSLAHSKAFETIDDYILELTMELTKVRGDRLRSLAIAYDNQAAFALYRLLKNLRGVRFLKDKKSVLQERETELYDHIKGVIDHSGQRLQLPPEWEIRRWSYNLALASINLDSGMEYVKMVTTIFLLPLPKGGGDEDYHYSLNW